LLPVLLLARPVRVLLARWLPLDPDTPRHWLGLVALIWFSLMPLMTLPLLGGEPLLQAMAAQAGQDAIDPISPSTLMYSLGWTVLLALVAVGFPRARRLPGALERLGLTWPGWRAIVVALAISVVMVPVFQGVDQVTTAIVEALGIPPTSSAWIERLFGRTFGIGLALAAAVSAGLGEELIWRGVVQPRYGLVLAALGFGAMHGFQYGLDGLVSVFLAGLVLGIVRQRSNTTVSAVVHGAYDFWGLLGILVGWW
jgi:membrane protease YdiL (CAAX protease family)